MPEPDYSEKIEFSQYGIRMAVVAPNGHVTHLDNWEPEVFGGTLPSVGDFFTTLWDPKKPEPAESYQVIERHWIGELMGDNCWWLLLKTVEPSATHRRLFEVARKQSAMTRSLGGSTYADLVELRKALEKKKVKAMPGRKRPSPK